MYVKFIHVGRIMKVNDAVTDSIEMTAQLQPNDDVEKSYAELEKLINNKLPRTG